MSGDVESVAGWPVMLSVVGRRCLVVGGGAVAVRRVKSLMAAGAEVTVVAPRVVDALKGAGVGWLARRFEVADLEGVFLVVVATDDAAVNERVSELAAAGGVLVNRADEPAAGDVTAMAHGRVGPVTVAVDSGGNSARASAAIRDSLLECIDPDLITLLEEAGRWRAEVQASVSDHVERAGRLRRLADAAALAILKDRGLSALRDHLGAVSRGETRSG